MIQHQEKIFFIYLFFIIIIIVIIIIIIIIIIILSSTKGLCLTTERNPLKNKLVLHIIATLINIIYAEGKS